MGVKGRLVPPRTLTSTETVEPSFRIFYRMTKDTKLGHYPSILSTATPVPIAASRRLALPIFSDIRSAPTVATSARMETRCFFSFCYAFCLAFSDAHDGVIAYALSRDAINTSVWLGEFSHDSAVGFGARPEQEFAGVARLRAFWSEESVVFW